MERDNKPLALLLVLSIVIQVGVLAVCRLRTGSIATYAFNSLDCTEFYHLALNIAEAGVFSRVMDYPLVPDTWRTPGYPVVLAILIFLFGDRPWQLILFQQLLSVVNVMALALIVRRYSSARLALMAGLLFLVEPFHQLYSLWLLSVTVFTAVLLATWYAWSRAIGADRLWWFVLAGGLSGCLVLVRPLAILVPWLLAVCIIVLALRKGVSYGRALARAGVFAGVAAAIIGSWMLRNEIVAGHFAISSQSGVVLAYFKATEVVLWREGRSVQRYLETSLDEHGLEQPHSVWERIDQQLQERFAGANQQQLQTLNWRQLAQGNQSAFDPFEVSNALRQIGINSLLESPGSTLVCCAVRCASILTFPLNLALNPPDLPAAPGRVRSFVIGLVYLALLVAVGVNLVRRRLSLAAACFPLGVTIALLVATTPQVDPRFRVPMIPLLIFAALVDDRRQQESGERGG